MRRFYGLLILPISLFISLASAASVNFPKNIDKNLQIRVLLSTEVDKFYLTIGNKKEEGWDYRTFISKYKNEKAEFKSEAFFELVLALDGEYLKYNLKPTDTVEVKKCGDALQVVLKLPLAEYLAVVVNSEMPSSWPLEALKAQAVTARTYVLNQLEFSRDVDYDVASSVADQRFNGTEKVSERSLMAVKSTENQILLDKYGLLLSVFYSSSQGGIISAPEFTWKTAARHYLSPKRTYIEDGPFASWQRKYHKGELKELIGLHFMQIDEILPVGQQDYLLVSSDLRKTKLLIGEELRHKLSLPSASFIIKQEKDTWVFLGHGFGHGIGMSQYGAKAMANDAKTYIDILAFYYPQSHIREI